MESTPKAAQSTTKQRDPKPHLRLVRLVPGTPDIGVESLYDCRRELIPLFVRFHAEQGKDNVALDPDWDTLLGMTLQGRLRVVTIRDEGVLVGFMLNVLGPPLFYKSTLHGSTIAYWLDPVYRTGWFPIKLFRRNLELLKEWGCRRVFIAVDAEFKAGRMGKVFERIGYKLHETHYKALLDG